MTREAATAARIPGDAIEPGRAAAPARRSRAPSAGAMEAVADAGFIAIGALMIAANRPIGVQWADDGPQAGYFPFRIGILLVLCGALALVRALRARARRAEPFVTRARFRSVLAVALPTAAYVLGIQFLGIYVASAAFLLYFMRAIGRYGWLPAGAVGLGFAALTFWTFELQFLLPLPKGPLEAWLGY